MMEIITINFGIPSEFSCLDKLIIILLDIIRQFCFSFLVIVVY